MTLLLVSAIPWAWSPSLVCRHVRPEVRHRPWAMAISPTAEPISPVPASAATKVEELQNHITFLELSLDARQEHLEELLEQLDAAEIERDDAVAVLEKAGLDPEGPLQAARHALTLSALSLDARGEQLDELSEELQEAEAERDEAIREQLLLSESLEAKDAELGEMWSKLADARQQVRRLERHQLIQQQHSARFIKTAKGVVKPTLNHVKAFAKGIGDAAEEWTEAATEAGEVLAEAAVATTRKTRTA